MKSPATQEAAATTESRAAAGLGRDGSGAARQLAALPAGPLSRSPRMAAQRQAIASLFGNAVFQRMDDGMDVESSSESESDSDSDYEEEVVGAPPGYMTPSDYHDQYPGSDHSDLDGVVAVARVGNRPALWWLAPNEEDTLQLTGTRAGDIAALGGDDPGYTWHHCADYAGGSCTMQQVPTNQHSSWGHIGGASQAGYGEDG
jgi:hypothetical protein